MNRSLEIFPDGRVYEFADDQAVKVTETNGQVAALLDALQFTFATTFAIAPADKPPPDVAERRGSRTMNAEGLRLLTTFEGCKLSAYDDGGGVWTIGYGHIKTAKKGMTITQAKAEELLQTDLSKFESFVEDAVQVSLNDDQFSALVCFSFNVGAGQAGFGGSTLLKLLNQGDFEGAANQFSRWNKVKGKPWLGLTRRRLAEQALFLGQPWQPFLTYEETATKETAAKESTQRVLKLTDPCMTGEDVRQLQAALQKAGIAISVDGVFGRGTEKLVKQFQQQKNLEADGIVGTGTRKALGL